MPDGARIHADLYSFLHDVASADSEQAAWALWVAFMGKLGASHAALALNVLSPSRLARFTGPEWATRQFFDEGHYLEPRALVALTRGKGQYRWGVSSWGDSPPGRAARRAFEEKLAAAGIRGGVSQCVRIDNQYAGCAVMLDCGPEELLAFHQDHGATLEAAGLATLRRLVDLQWARVRQKSLGRRELECLLCLAAGMRSDEIAGKLGISTDTVDFHFRNLRRKLGARTREQALAVAIAAGLLSVP